MNILRAENLRRVHIRGTSEVRALDGVSIEIATGSFTTITGPSGSGKSTLLQVLGLLDAPTSGTLTLGGQDAGEMSDDDRARIRRTTFGFVFQSFHLLPGLSAWENVAVPRMLDGVTLRAARSDAVGLLSEVGLGERADHRPHEMSGGEQQRVAIARALIASPAIVFADEPTGALDQTSSAMVIDLLHRLTVGCGRSLVLVTHDPAIAVSHAARQVRLRDGRPEQLDGADAPDELDALDALANP